MTARWGLTLLALLFVLVGVACDGDEGPPSASPSPSFPTETASPLTGPTGIVPSIVPPGGADNLTAGSVSFQMDGDAELETTLRTLITGIAAPPPAGFAIVWSREGTDATTLGIGGGSFVGTRSTSTALTLTIAAEASSGFSTWISSAGECQVTIDTAQADRMTGSFTCDDLRSNNGRSVDVSGRFEATG
jgi:hypothetical protein